ncbi:MAG: HEAT repeat domain-containing protein [Roseateles sp.]|uniref:HEAT repeat domain-containing protein n=1 Tax=Roseateles sp. TaxID=1971397 RepID=UPI0040362A37
MEPTLRAADTPGLTADDRLEVQAMANPFHFERSVDAELAARIVETINRMGGAGEVAERCYQQALDGLARRGKEVVHALAEEVGRLAEDRYLDRWALVQLMAELKHESALDPLDRLLSSRIPEERSADPHGFTTAGEEVMIRTTAVEAVTRLAADGSQRACELLLRHTGHENFSVRRAAVQGYLTHGGEKAEETLRQTLPERDHFILGIRRIDVRQAPQAQGGLYLKAKERDVPAHDLNPSSGCGTEGNGGGKDGDGDCDCKH